MLPLPKRMPSRVQPRRLDYGEQLAVWTFRCVPQPARTCLPLTASASPPLARDLQAAIDGLRGVHQLMVTTQGRGLTVGALSCVDTTRDERRLLKATAFAQTEAHELVDNFLFRLAPSHQIRLRLTQAIMTLACSLGASGYWLPANDTQPTQPPMATALYGAWTQALR